MKWFQGTIPEAVQLSKNNESVFIVYISGDDHLSKNMDQTWEDRSIADICSNGQCVAITMKADSEVCKYFSEIYPVVVVPSTFFIGLNGVPLEVIAGHLEPSSFLEKIKDVFQKHNEERKKESPAAVVDHMTVGTPHDPIKSGSSTPEAASSESNVQESATENKNRSEDVEVIVKRTKLIQERQDEKKRKIVEDEKTKVLEAQKMGRDLQKLKRYQEDVWAKELREEIKKKKLQDQLARKRIKEEIERDRTERQAKYLMHKEEQECAEKAAKEMKMHAEQKAVAEAEAHQRQTSRLQFRLPDGSSVTHQFASSEPLSTAQQFIAQHLNRSVTLSTTYPKRTFTSDHMSSSLLSLGLAPSSVVLVIPHQGVIEKKMESGVGLLNMLMAPVVMLWNFVYSMIFGQSPTAPAASAALQRKQEKNTDSASSQSARPQTAYRRRTPISRQEGSIHRFNNQDDDDTDTATWNGNSTQQM